MHDPSKPLSVSGGRHAPFTRRTKGRETQLGLREWSVERSSVAQDVIAVVEIDDDDVDVVLESWPLKILQGLRDLLLLSRVLLAFQSWGAALHESATTGGFRAFRQQVPRVLDPRAREAGV